MAQMPKKQLSDPGLGKPKCLSQEGEAGARPVRIATSSTAIAVLIAALLTGCGGDRESQRGDPVVLAAAASLHNAIGALAPLVEAADLELVTNFAGSNVLAMQIEATPAADVFISADPDWIDYLDARGRLRPGTRQTLLSNRLVVIGHPDYATIRSGASSLAGLESLARSPPAVLVLADPRAVPAGRYARRVLEDVVLPDGASLWTRLVDRVVPTADARAALAMTDAQPEAYGIVYATDALDARRAQVLWEIPADRTPDIHYVAAAVAERPHTDRADRLLAVLTSPSAQAIFTRHGFSIAPTPQAH